MSEMTVEQFQKAQEAEYSAYVATEQIHIGGALAFNVGDPVPKGHVDRGVVDKTQVAKPESKAGVTAQAANPVSPVQPTEKGEK